MNVFEISILIAMNIFWGYVWYQVGYYFSKRNKK